MAAKLNVQSSLPRLAERQRHHDNTEATTAEDFYCLVTGVPVLETFIS